MRSCPNMPRLHQKMTWKSAGRRRKAVELDESLAEAHTSLGNALVLNLQFSDQCRNFNGRLNSTLTMPRRTTGTEKSFKMNGDWTRRWRNSGARRNFNHYPSLLIRSSVRPCIGGARPRSNPSVAKTIENHPNFDLAPRFFGQANQGKGRVTKTIIRYKKAIKLNSDPTVLAPPARASVAGRNNRRGRYSTTEQINPGNVIFRPIRLAVVHLSLGDKDEALRLLEKSDEHLAPFDTGSSAASRSIEGLTCSAAIHVLKHSPVR